MTSTNTSISLAERFWRWVYSISSEKLKAIYLERTGWDLKCPNCKCWASNAGITLESWNDEQSRYKCDQCGEVTAWHFEGMVAWPVPIVYWPNKEKVA